MAKVFDHRKGEYAYHNGRFSVDSIESIETISENADYIVRLKNGQEHIFRCSCCIIFDNSTGITQMVIS